MPVMGGDIPDGFRVENGVAALPTTLRGCRTKIGDCGRSPNLPVVFPEDDHDVRRIMKRIVLVMMLAALLVLMVAPAASAHVHGVTPLNDCGQANANAGGNGTNGTPADDATGGPITGLIPRDTAPPGPLAGGEGGSGATNGNCIGADDARL